jgi:hypothetical protein
MSTATGILGGALALAAAQLLLSSQQATSAFGSLATVPASWIEKIMDATVAAIPNHPLTAPAGSASGSSYPTPDSGGGITAASVPAPSSLPPVVSPPVLNA